MLLAELDLWQQAFPILCSGRETDSVRLWLIGGRSTVDGRTQSLEVKEMKNFE
jgi:hypothetical protein